MDDKSLTSFLHRMGINAGPASHSGWMHAKCPFAQWTHSKGTDHSASFAAIADPKGRSSFVCMACKQKGPIVALPNALIRFRGDPTGALAKVQQEIAIAEITGRKLDTFEAADMPAEEVSEPLSEAVFSGMWDDVGDHDAARAFVQGRRVSREAVNWIGMGFDPEARRVVFPVRDTSGGLWGFTGRSILPDSTMKVKDYAGLPKRRLIMGADRWVPGRPILLVEGLFAYARFITERAHLQWNVGALLGSVLTAEKAAILVDYDSAVYAFLDPDEAGNDGVWGARRKTGRLLPDGSDEKVRDFSSGLVGQLHQHLPVFITTYPEGIRDPDDLSLEGISAMVDHARFYLPGGRPSF
jgi:hypothetical protein